MKIDYEGQHFKYSIYAFLVIVASIFVYKTLDNIEVIYKFLMSMIRLIVPFFIGGFIAYILNKPICWLEKNAYKKVKKKLTYSKRRRFLSILTVYIIFWGLISWWGTSVLPQIAGSFTDLIDRIPQYTINFDDFLIGLPQRYDFIIPYEVIEEAIYNLSITIQNLIAEYDFKNIETFLAGVARGVFNVTAVVLNLVLGFMIAFYLQMEKEVFSKGIKRFLRAFFKDEKVDSIANFAKEADQVFSKFIIGKSIDSIIIGILCFLGLVMLNVRYATMISVMIGITNMIPYFGPLIGGVPAVIITLFDSPIKAIWVGIFILILQQFDGLVLGPKILGDSTGLSPVWIIFAIIVGGGLFGVLGMFLGVPVVAVIRLLLMRFIDKRICEKELAQQQEE